MMATTSKDNENGDDEDDSNSVNHGVETKVTTRRMIKKRITRPIKGR